MISDQERIRRVLDRLPPELVEYAEAWLVKLDSAETIEEVAECAQGITELLKPGRRRQSERGGA